MSGLESERLYNLLPALYRQRDTGEALRALLAIMEQELARMEADTETLYENWFIETCEEWVIPYIGDLLGIEGLADSAQKLANPRARVGNAIAYRRRKGVAGLLESLARDLSGWETQVVEFFEHVAITQHVQHVRPNKGATFNIRDEQAVEQLGTPFDAASHLADLRGMASGRGRHNLGSSGLFVWRLRSYWLDRCEALRVKKGCYTLHPAGVDMPLFNYPQPQPDPSQAAEAIHLPLRLGRQQLRRELEQRRLALAEGRVPAELFFGQHPAFELFLGDINGDPVPSEQIAIADLGGWEEKNWKWPDDLFSDPVDQASGGEQLLIKAVVDPELGRLILAKSESVEKVYASYAYGFSADMGGGPYSRQHTLTTPDPGNWLGVVDSRTESEAGQNRFQSLAEALAAWKKAEPGKAIIRIADNSIHNVTGLVIELAGGQHLVIEAADGMRPLVYHDNDWLIAATGPDVHLTCNGLLINSYLPVEFNEDLNLSLTHCTVRDAVGVTHTGTNIGRACVSISDSITGPLILDDKLDELTAVDSIINLGGYDMAIAGIDDESRGPAAVLERVTILDGKVTVKSLRARDVIFAHSPQVDNEEEGSIGTSYVPDGSQMPPLFTSTSYGQPGFAQLNQACPEEIRRGGTDHSEMGVFQRLYQPQHEANLHRHLAEYVPVGQELGIHFET